MGYSTTRYEPTDKKDKKWRVHPIWRGIGCILLIIMPIIAFLAAQTFMRMNRWVALPSGLYRIVSIPLVMLVVVFAKTLATAGVAPWLAPLGQLAWPWYVPLGTALAVLTGIVSSLTRTEGSR